MFTTCMITEWWNQLGEIPYWSILKLLKMKNGVTIIVRMKCFVWEYRLLIPVWKKMCQYVVLESQCCAITVKVSKFLWFLFSRIFLTIRQKIKNRTKVSFSYYHSPIKVRNRVHVHVCIIINRTKGTSVIWLKLIGDPVLQPSLLSQWQYFTFTRNVPTRSLHHLPSSGPTSPLMAHCRMYRTSQWPS